MPERLAEMLLDLWTPLIILWITVLPYIYMAPMTPSQVLPSGSSLGLNVVSEEQRVLNRSKRGWVWNQMFVLEEFSGPEPILVGRYLFNNPRSLQVGCYVPVIPITRHSGAGGSLQLGTSGSAHDEHDAVFLPWEPVLWMKVYASFALCMFVAATGAYVHVVIHFIQAGLLSALGSLGLMIWLMVTLHSHETGQKRLGLLTGFTFLTGVGLGPALDLCIAINPSFIPTSFLGRAMIFSCFTLSALYARHRSYLFLGGILMSAMSLMLFSFLGNLFFGSFWLFQANLYVRLVVMCGFVLFDTQLIIEKAENGDKDYIWHCVDLFLDFVTLFRKLLMILTMNEKDKKKEKK
ncbi:bax inhibitor 1-like [Trichosurus vulpecula]|uniref:bax inhibitor 1-like n=1 Tax=Trichosurus vulpecula TaxID=9337 RepID=UPI00186B0B18|nr:bax inhibitor 1-like [Trichosurus vulpecula]